MFFRPRRNRPNHVARKARGVASNATGAPRQRGGMVESLEPRMLLTLLTGGGTGQESTFEYVAKDNTLYRISLRGNITAEFIGVEVPDGDNGVRQRRAVDLRPAIASPPANYGVDLFSIYISRSDANASIAIASVPAITAENRPMNPFGGAVSDFTVINARTGRQDSAAPAGNTGGVLIGARTGDTISNTTDEEKRAISTIPLTRAFGARPKSPKGKLDAGISTAPGVNIGQILIGGTITGRVNISGSVGTFYAGQIWTGDAEGIFNGQETTMPANFVISGDVKNVISRGSIGTTALDQEGTLRVEPDFKTGVDMQFGGRVGQIVTKGSFLGAISVQNDPNFRGVGDDVTEIEVRDIDKEGSESFFEGNDFTRDVLRAKPSLGDNAVFNNDTLATAQYLGTQRNTALRSNAAIRVRGEIVDNTIVQDSIDYYAITLLAGQTAQVQMQETDITGEILNQPNNQFLAVGVMDPDGRLLTSDLSNNDLAATLGKPFRFTAQTPGVYYIAVANGNDFNFDGVVGDGNGELGSFAGTVPYVLDITRVGDLALGAVVVDDGLVNNDSIGDAPVSAGVHNIVVQNGDLGGLISTSAGVGSAGGGTSGESYLLAEGSAPITVSKGNLRAVVFASIGLQDNGGTSFGPNLHVPKGSVGLLRATGTDGDFVLALNTSLVDVSGAFLKTDSIGYDYQLVDAARIMDANLLADRGIGVIRADTISSAFHAPRFAVNADSSGNDGFIDEIDVRTSLGTIQAGGPQISTGPSGNVRYIHVPAAADLFRDRFFGGGRFEFRTFAAGVPYRYTDDSGATVKITPLPQNFDSNNQLVNPRALSVRSYGIRDKGGSVLVNVGVDTEVDLVNNIELQSGIQIDSGNGVGAGSVEIGEIEMAGTGSPIAFNFANRTFTTTSTASEPVTIFMKGRRAVDVFSILGQNINTLDNRTSGEIVNITATNLGTVSVNNLGIAKTRTGTTIQNVDIVRDVFPFSMQRTLINITNNVASVTARGAVGNIWLHGATSTAFGTLSVNSDRVNDKSVFEGIDAPIVLGIEGSLTKVDLLSVNIGEGITPSGAGDFEWSGLFINGGIVNVTNQGLGSDIRGDIVTSSAGIIIGGNGNGSSSDITSLGSIGTIKLNDGSIIDADILVDNDWEDSLDVPRQISTGSVGVFLGNEAIPLINSIELDGIGGIIGSLISANGIGNVTVAGGFGVVDSSFLTDASSDFGGIDTDGYGIRFSVVDGGATITNLIARGTGKILSTNEYTPSVRNSERIVFDSQSGRLLSRYNDLHKFLDTSKSHPKNLTTSVAGTIEDSLFTGARNLTRLEAYRIFGSNTRFPSLPGAGAIFGGITGAETSSMRVSFAERVAKTVVRENIDGLQFTAGNVGSFDVGNNMLNSGIEVDGTIGSFTTGNLKASATVQALGNEGRINSFTTKRALFGVVNASVMIGTLTVGTDLASHSVSSSNDIGTVNINGSILAGALLRAADRIDSLNIGHNIDDGGTVRAKRIGAQRIKGEVNGDIVIG